MTREAQAHAARADQHTQRDVKVPGLVDQRGEQQSDRHQAHAQLHHDPRAVAIHQAAEQGAQNCRNEETERERTRRHAAFPAELIEDRREQQRKRGARADTHAHRHERDGDDHPAVEERQAPGDHGVTRTRPRNSQAPRGSAAA